MTLFQSWFTMRYQWLKATAVILAGGMAGQAFASIQINIVEPSPNAIIHDRLTIRASVSSTFQLQGVIATVEELSTGLTFSTLSGQWEGSLDVSSRPWGTHTLSVIATDIFGDRGQALRDFREDLPPQVAWQTRSFSVARPSLRITATCDDDDPNGCSRLEIVADSADLIASGTTSVDTEVSLSRWIDQGIPIDAIGIDSAGQRTSRRITVYVDDSSSLVEAETVDGFIWDFNDQRVLFLSPQGLLVIRDRATGEETTIPEFPGFQPYFDFLIPHGFLTPLGAIFVTISPQIRCRILEWRGELVDLGLTSDPCGPAASGPLAAAGQYAVWQSDRELLFRDLLACTSVALPSGSGVSMSPLALNGDLVYSRGTPARIFRYRGGESLQMTTDGSSPSYDLGAITDGINIAYFNSGTGPPFSVRLLLADGTSLELVRSDSVVRELSSYQVNNGWAAFMRPAPATLQVWTRSPAGDESQQSFFGSSSQLDALGPDGRTLFIHDRDRFMGFPGAFPQRISSRLGKGSFLQADGYVAMGRSLFRVKP